MITSAKDRERIPIQRSTFMIAILVWFGLGWLLMGRGFIFKVCLKELYGGGEFFGFMPPGVAFLKLPRFSP